MLEKYRAFLPRIPKFSNNRLFLLAFLSAIYISACKTFPDFDKSNFVEIGGVKYRLSLEDNFEGSNLNMSLWIDEYFPGRLKSSMPARYKIKNGYLYLYSSGIQTHNQHNLHKVYSSPSESVPVDDRFSQLYGYYEIRAKVSETSHHVAFWALETKAFGNEIDVFEGPAWPKANFRVWDENEKVFLKNQVRFRSYNDITSPELRALEFNTYGLQIYSDGARIYHNGKLLEESIIDWKNRGEIPLMFLLSVYGNPQNGKPFVVDYFKVYTPLKGQQGMIKL